MDLSWRAHQPALGPYSARYEPHMLRSRSHTDPDIRDRGYPGQRTPPYQPPPGSTMTLKLTLDTNCFIDLDENREPSAGCVRSLIALHSAGNVCLRLVGSSASERQRVGPYLTNFAQFKSRLEALEIGHLELLLPPAVFDVSYLDWCVLLGDDDIPLLESIHHALFPGQPYELIRQPHSVILVGVS
jgi:hypothetical protein